MSLLLLQLADAAFPVGAFAHSGGLEAAWQQGEVNGSVELGAFVRDVVVQAGWAGLPLLNAAYANPERLDELDALCDAFLSNPVANRASRAQGRALVGTSARVFASAALSALDQRVRRDELHAHHAPLFGATLRALDLPLAEAQRVFLYLTCRGALSAAVRLGLVGPIEAQALQFDCAPHVEAVLSNCANLIETDLAQTAPIIELLQSTHDRLYSRLFQS